MLILHKIENNRIVHTEAFDSLNQFDNYAYHHSDDIVSMEAFYFKYGGFSHLRPNAYDDTTEAKVARIRAKWISKEGLKDLR